MLLFPELCFIHPMHSLLVVYMDNWVGQMENCLRFEECHTTVKTIHCHRWIPGLVKCEMDIEEGKEAFARLESYVQEIKDGGDEDVAFWPGTVDTGADEDRKRLKLMLKMEPPCLWVAELNVRAGSDSF
jgi:hypothetical protein